MLDAKQLLQTETTDQVKILGEWLTSESLTMLHAYRGVGKTFFAFEVAYSVAAGQDFLCWPCHVARSVVYFDGEMGIRQMKGRLRRAIDGHAIGAESDNLHFQCYDMCDNQRMWNLSEPEDQAKYSAALAPHHVAIIDNIATCVKSRPRESDVETWARVQDWAIRERGKGKAILFIHHSGKAMTQRGTSTKEDVLDTVMNLVSQYNPNGNSFELNFEKHRNFYGPQAESLVITQEGEPMGWTYINAFDSMKRNVAEMKELGMTNAQICDELRINMSTLKKIQNGDNGATGDPTTDSERDEIISMRRNRGMSLKEISKETGIKLPTIKSVLYKELGYVGPEDDDEGGNLF